jgi:hypothetical protein
LGNVSNVKITGGTNGFVLQTDGTGNLDWTAQTGGGGNGSPGGSNTQVQYNDSGLFGGNIGFTFNEVSGVFTAPILAGNANGLFNIVAANITGTVANATHSTVADVANSVAGANVSGQVSFAATANAVAGANVSGAVNLATYATTANSVAGANVTGSVASAVTAGTAGSAGSATTAGTVTTNAQPNITSVGTLTDLRISNSSIHLGNNAASTNYQGVLTVAIGNNAGSANLKNEAIAIGNGAGQGQSNANVFYGQFAISIGTNSGSNADTGSISIGVNSGNTAGAEAISIGNGANAQGDTSIAIGAAAKAIPNSSVSIGYFAQTGNINGIAIGTSATTSGANAIAIGQSTTAEVNTIVLNASNSALTSNGITDALFIKPVRSVNSTSGLNQLYYNSTTGEIVVYVP